MKKLTILICILAMLLALTGIVSASPPERKTFTITGCQVPYEFNPLPSGLIKFRIAATGTVNGDFQGSFTFDEWGILDRDSGRGTNHGIMEINSDQVVIRFGGQSDLVNVWGNFTVLEGTGGLHGQGTYTGYTSTTGECPPPYYVPFTVTFEGRFHTAP